MSRQPPERSRGKALVVGHRGPRSVVAAASYEARKRGFDSKVIVDASSALDLIIGSP